MLRLSAARRTPSLAKIPKQVPACPIASMAYSTWYKRPTKQRDTNGTRDRTPWIQEKPAGYSQQPDFYCSTMDAVINMLFQRTKRMNLTPTYMCSSPHTKSKILKQNKLSLEQVNFSNLPSGENMVVLESYLRDCEGKTER